MKRSSAGEWTASIALALGLHLALVLIVLLGQWLSRLLPAPPAAGVPISAELVDANALSAAMQRTLRDRPQPVEEPPPTEVLPEPEPLPQPVPEEPQPEAQDFIPHPDTVSQEEVTDLPTPVPAEEKQVQEAKQRQEQVDLTEQNRQLEEQRRERLTEMEKERLRQLEDIRRRRAAAAREAQLAEQKLEQLAHARSRGAAEDAAASDASAPPGNYGTDTGLQARYAEALRQAILSKWTRPDTVPLGAMCRLNIRQLPGGEVVDVQVASPCAYDEAGRRSIEAAVLKAQPLPYAGFESVFQRSLNLNFRAEDR